jgi:protein gp37
LLADWHVYQVLTKRSERMKEMLNGKLNYAAEAGHIFWGVSAENREYGLPRIKDLRGTKIRNRFLSVEPLLDDIGKINLNGINWVIVGGESGPGCRPMKAEWALSVRDQCQQANVPFFFKQWGGYPKKKYGRTLEGKLYDEFPQADTNPDIMPRKERLALAESIEAELLTTTYPQELVSIHT